ncbi:MAG: T9SS type A sorting domain-containing protein, partial [Cytophagales bacterium]|nr:T9SS type A sorting domain-containing protein [Cytophagales bacterium]
ATDNAWQNPSLFGTAKLGDLPTSLGITSKSLGQSSSIQSKQDITVYPNPSISAFQLTTKTPIEVKVMDNLGKVLEEFTVIDHQSFGEAYAAGIYHVIISDESGSKSIVKLVKEN